MLSKGTKLYSIITGACPKCHQDKMYVDNNPYNLPDTMKMHEHCTHCGLTYKVEPNFFFGAMYVSYGVAVGLGVLIFLICHYVIGTGLMTSFIAIMVILILSMPWITRISRNIYINIFIDYDPSAANNKPA